jgi:hypothetical protein
MLPLSRLPSWFSGSEILPQVLEIFSGQGGALVDRTDLLRRVFVENLTSQTRPHRRLYHKFFERLSNALKQGSADSRRVDDTCGSW